MLKGTRTAHTMQLDLLLASHFLNKACECHCPATVFSDIMQGCWSFPLIAYYAMLKGTRTAHTMQLDLLLASHFLNKACECHCPATVFSDFMQGCWSFPLIAYYAMLKGTRTAHTMQLDLLLASHFLNKACECHCPATVFSDIMQGCWSFPLIAHYAMLKGTRTAHTRQLDLLLASHFLNKACECHCPAKAVVHWLLAIGSGISTPASTPFNRLPPATGTRISPSQPLELQR